MSNPVEFLPLVLLAFVFWFLILRPMRKRQKLFAQTQQAIAVGSHVMLASGIFGEVVSLTDDGRAELKIAPETTVTVLRQAIASVHDPEQPESI